MSMTLPIDKLVAIIRAFTHEISRVVDSFDGYVLKYVGDAVISFFPGNLSNDSNDNNNYLSSNTSVECAKSMIYHILGNSSSAKKVLEQLRSIRMDHYHMYEESS
jgi:class 3 adenylate cyclase